MGLLDRSALAGAEESTGGGFRRMEPCVCMCRVQAVRTEWTDAAGKRWTHRDKEYVKVIVDVDEGEFAGEFSKDYWAGEDRDWGHTLYMSWTARALGMLKHTFRSFAEANPGFDAEAALDAEQWQMFIGKRVLVYWSGEEYEANDGSVRVRVRPDRAVTADDHVEPRVKTLDGKSMAWGDYRERGELAGRRGAGGGAAPAAAYGSEDIPF